MTGRSLPMFRDECYDMEGACPYVSCRHNLYLDINPPSRGETPRIYINFKDKEVEDCGQLCSLKLAERGGMEAKEIAEELGMSRQAVFNAINSALAKMRAAVAEGKFGELSDHADRVL